MTHLRLLQAEQRLPVKGHATLAPSVIDLISQSFAPKTLYPQSGVTSLRIQPTYAIAENATAQIVRALGTGMSVARRLSPDGRLGVFRNISVQIVHSIHLT